MNKLKKIKNENTDYQNEPKDKSSLCFYRHFKRADKIYLFDTTVFICINNLMKLNIY